MLINLFNIEMAKNDVDNELNKKFMSKDKFAEEVEDLVKKTKMNYIDAIVQFCEENSIELDGISKMISKPLKEKLRYDATELNFLRKTTKAKLPL